ncbi:hypothetical protein H8N03_11555 [Ramlibacter sp. USB13]|uniref:Lipoprotein n=1 Tax=Ramlibacter cellulosilyticus TaxID=2764187 RepID=A0A923SF48_9BURK|nr:hypothetical protein [Ramlibacter cellulosilyticus]MBC5783582.1 hypothetical protein [Ramlibacter cellulosilyticus]
MKLRGLLALALLAAAIAGCDGSRRNDTAVLGGNGQGGGGEQALVDARGRAIPRPPAPPGTTVQAVRSAEDAALAAWVADDHVVASAWTPATGWSAPEPLERIYGESRDVQLASNGQGQAMAVWHHRVGNIHSLRFSRFDANGWSLPDVLPGALPRPAVAGTPAGQDAPQLQMDAQGNVMAQWPSGFHANELQVARYTAGQGWSRAVSEPVASAPSASPPSPAPSSAR